MNSVITQDLFGQTKCGTAIQRYCLKNTHGMSVDIINLGAAVTAIRVPDKHGHVADVVCGYDTVAGYEANCCYFGVLVGRSANRIAKGIFTVDGQTVQLEVNNGPNHLHGGTEGGFSKKIWEATIDGGRLVLRYVSQDGEAFYPGQVTCQVTYELNDENELIIDYKATCTKPTPVNLCNHSYFNLAGHDTSDIYDHRIFLYVDQYTPKDDTNIPTGVISDVTGSPFDLRNGVLLGERIPQIPLLDPNDQPGFDHNFCTGSAGKRKLVARVEHDGSGRVMECLTDQPGLQFYTANWVHNEAGKGGVTYNRHCALCLETQNYPDAPNKPNFPKSILRPGEEYLTTTVYKFSLK